MTNEWYRNAYNKGFHDNDEMGPDGTPSPRQRLAWVALILTEWFEEQQDLLSGDVWSIDEKGKPVGAFSETIDIFIRCADTLGACGASLDGPALDLGTDNINWYLATAAEATRSGEHSIYAQALRKVMDICRNTIYDNAPDFDEALRLKTDYNRTRKRMHGKLA